LEELGKLVEQVAKTVDRFKEDSISDGQARDWLAQRLAAQLELDPRGRLRWCVAPHVGTKGLASALLTERPLWRAIRKSTARQRQRRGAPFAPELAQVEPKGKK